MYELKRWTIRKFVPNSYFVYNLMTIHELRSAISSAVSEAFPGKEVPDFVVEPPENPDFGDYATNVAMILAARDRIVPIIAANRLAEKLSAKLSQEVEVSPAAPGFVNFRLKPAFLQGEVAAILAAGEKYGKSDWGAETRAIVEFVSANPTGPLTIANARGGFLGDTLARVLKLFGAKLMREYYVNDMGGQIEILGKSILAAKGAYKPTKDEQLYQADYINVLAPKLKGTDSLDLGEAAALSILDQIIKPELIRAGIEFDQFFSEKSLEKTGQIRQVLGMLKKKGLAFEKEGAIWLSARQFGSQTDRVLVRQDGRHTYLASDIVYHLNKIKRGYNLLITIVGADHSGELPIVKKMIDDLLRYDLGWNGEMRLIMTQMVKLLRKGKEIKISKRRGHYVSLAELLNEVGLDAARFFFLLYSADAHMIFDLDLAKEKSEKNPVFRVQYGYARLSSILRKAHGLSWGTDKLNLLTHPHEHALIKKLIQFPEVVEDVATTYQIQKLPHYALDLVGELHSFYERVRVISDNQDLTRARLALIKAAQIVLKNTLSLMGISAPQKM
jgi:arginyl-tRNA synthetase